MVELHFPKHAGTVQYSVSICLFSKILLNSGRMCLSAVYAFSTMRTPLSQALGSVLLQRYLPQPTTSHRTPNLWAIGSGKEDDAHLIYFATA